MKKYVSLKCSKCARTKDQLINSTHYAPDRCTITLGCEGRLSPVGYTSDGSTILDVAPAGLSNWYPRGTTVTTAQAVQADTMYNTSTGSKQQVVIGVSDTVLGFHPSDTAVLTLSLNAEKQTAKDFRQYTYRKTTPFTAVNGVEDSQAKKVLRYDVTSTNPDQVDVYLNGVKRTLGTDYLLYDGSVGSAVPPNTVLFTSTVTGSSNQVDVIVTKASVVNETLMVFSRAINDESRTGTGAWEGVSAVRTAQGGTFTLFYCDFAELTSTLASDVKFTVNGASIVDVPNGPSLEVTSVVMLLSRANLYTAIDRQRAVWIPVLDLDTNTDYLIIRTANGVKSLMVTEHSAVDVFPIMEVIRHGPPTLQTTNLSGNDEAAELDNELISGPDA